MGIDDITLSPELCERLYENVIVNTAQKPAQKPEKPVSLSFEGKNQKKILVAYDVAKLKKEERDMLVKLLAACQLSTDDIALVNIHITELSIAKIVEELKIANAILFGIPSLSIDLPLDDKENIVIDYNRCAFIRTGPISVLNNSVEKKKALWMALKTMFRILN